MQRLYPPFGAIPGPVPGNHHLRVGSDKAVAQLGAFCALPTGLLATLHTAAVSDGLLDAFPFARHNEPDQPGDLTVLATPVDLPHDHVPANEVRGGGGHDNGIDARTFTLWFPVDVATLGGALRLTLSWPAAGPTPESIDIGRDDLLAAAQDSVWLDPTT